jgi:hypothetical protein
MSFFCKNAQEEALKEIAWQMKIRNIFDMIHELHELGDISDEAYIKDVKELMKTAK